MEGLDVEAEIRETMKHITEMLLKKNRDYGNSVFKPPMLMPQMKPGDGIMVRLSDKESRMVNLWGGRKPEVADEALIDTIDDSIGYRVLLRIVVKNGGDV
jgi:hypothetical protein